MEAPAWIRRPIEEAHRRGLKILVKPHLSYWGRYEWRGDIVYETDEECNRFFESYTEWIVQIAAFSRDADAFAVGTELGGTVHHEERWRQIIAQVRKQFGGPITYAANWDRYQDVGFWDAVDWIGVQAYFPVLDEGAVPAGEIPSQAQLDRGWARIMENVRSFGNRLGRPVVFTEVGYNNAANAPYEPWDYRTGGGPHTELIQQRCMAAALGAIAAEPAVHGAFLWKWFPGDRLPRNFAMSAPAIRRVIADHWLEGRRR